MPRPPAPPLSPTSASALRRPPPTLTRWPSPRRPVQGGYSMLSWDFKELAWDFKELAWDFTIVVSKVLWHSLMLEVLCGENFWARKSMKSTAVLVVSPTCFLSPSEQISNLYQKLPLRSLMHGKCCREIWRHHWITKQLRRRSAGHSPGSTCFSARGVPGRVPWRSATAAPPPHGPSTSRSPTTPAIRWTCKMCSRYRYTNKQ